MSKRKEELEQSYRNTTYSVFIEDKQYDIKIGNPIPQVVNDLVNKEKFAMVITAWNPRSHLLPLSENNIRNKELKSKLEHYTVFKSMGQGDGSTWPAEESFFILGMSIEAAKVLASEYEQYAFVLCEHDKSASLIFTDVWQ